MKDTNMITAVLIALSFVGLAVIPCIVALYIRSALYTIAPHPGSEPLQAHSN